ncbi:MAG TPA: TetR family transcriptional regulator [Nevskiaceae bacterium]|nr:TetR family transcriptional regulator [Nevskiaceae bacterium]
MSTTKAKPSSVPRSPPGRGQTRAALMEAALRLMGGGRGFTGLGLREIAREAGVVPNAFYRHFRDMDELGLALVEETGLTLRRLLREARKSPAPPSEIIRHSVQIYRQYIRDHRLHILFMAGERWGGSPAIRRAIRMEVHHFAAEMTQDLMDLRLMRMLDRPRLETVCGLVVNTMLNAAGDLLDLPPGQKAEDELMENFVQHLRVIFLGAGIWKSDRPPPSGTPA